MRARGYLEGQASLPSTFAHVSGRLATQASETREAPLLLARLRNDVTFGTSITNFFMDVQQFSGSRPMTLTIDDEVLLTPFQTPA